jgi:hypothetical protein
MQLFQVGVSVDKISLSIAIADGTRSTQSVGDVASNSDWFLTTCNADVLLHWAASSVTGIYVQSHVSTCPQD